MWYHDIVERRKEAIPLCGHKKECPIVRLHVGRVGGCVLCGQIVKEMISLKKLKKGLKFDAVWFFRGKTLTATASRPWVDFDSKEELGTKVDVVITKDTTDYGDPAISNLFEKLTIKVARKIEVPVGSIVMPVDPECTVYGTYGENLSVKASDLRIASGSANATLSRA